MMDALGGAVCFFNQTDPGDSYCACPPQRTLCADNTCRENCTGPGLPICTDDGLCQPGEGCNCIDCIGKQDSCTGGALCDANTSLCVCPINTTLLSDLTCGDPGPGSDCNSNGICEFGEGCDCDDCWNQPDSCIYGAICDPFQATCQCGEGTQLCEDGTCREDCGEISLCWDNGIVEPGETCGCVDCDREQCECPFGHICDFSIQTCVSCLHPVDCNADCVMSAVELNQYLYNFKQGTTPYDCQYGDRVTGQATGILLYTNPLFNQFVNPNPPPVVTSKLEKVFSCTSVVAEYPMVGIPPQQKYSTDNEWKNDMLCTLVINVTLDQLEEYLNLFLGP